MNNHDHLGRNRSSPARALHLSALFKEWQQEMMELVQASNKFINEYFKSCFHPKWATLAQCWMHKNLILGHDSENKN